MAAVKVDDVWAVGISSPTPGARGFGIGQTLIEHWDGTSWSVIPSPNPESDSGISGLAVVSASDIWAVGFSSASLSTGPFHTLTEHWDGTSWSVVPSPNPASVIGAVINELLGVVAVSADDVWAVGFAANTFFSSNLFTTTLVEHWDGHEWQVVPSESPGWGDNALRGITRVPGTQTLWAIGQSADTIQVLQPISEFSC